MGEVMSPSLRGVVLIRAAPASFSNVGTLQISTVGPTSRQSPRVLNRL